MPARPLSELAKQRDRLIYFVMVRQNDASCQAVRDAYERLALVAEEAVGWDPQTVILDWLQAELKTPQQPGGEGGSPAPQLMKAAVAMKKFLKQ
jgi:hypothetical protein